MKIALQVFQIFFGYLGSYSVKKKNILIFYLISTLFSMLMFWSVKEYAAILPVLTTGIRYFVFIFKDNYKTRIPLYFCLLLHFLALFLSVKTPIDFIPSVLVICGCLVYWFFDDLKLKLAAIIINIPWIGYYIYCGLYLTTVNVIVQCILLGLACLKIRKNNLKKVNKKH